MITNRNNTLKLRKHSIRDLTRTELNVVHGGGTGHTGQDWQDWQNQQNQQTQGGY